MTAIYWLLICVLLLGMELATMGMTMIWFAAGCFGAFIAANCGANLLVQLLVLTGGSALLLYAVRPIALRHLSSTPGINLESLIGNVAVVAENIDNLNNKGIASMGGELWHARSDNDKISFVQGEQVEITGVKGNKLIVRKYLRGM